MKKLLPQKKDLVIFIIGFLPALIALLRFSSIIFIFGDLPYIFNLFCYPIVILLVGILTSRYTSTLFCAGTTFISWAAAYFLSNLCFYGNVKDFFEWTFDKNLMLDYALMTLVVLAARGLVSLIIFIVYRIRRHAHPEITEEQNSKEKVNVLNFILIILCSADIAGFLISLILFKGTNTLDSIPGIMIAAISLFFALVLEFLITLLPKSHRFAAVLTIIFNAVFLALFIAVLFVYEILPLRFYMGSVSNSIAIVTFPIVHIIAATASLLVRKLVFSRPHR